MVVKILDLILSRRTVHAYTSEHVPKNIIEDAILAAIHAPNHRLTWPWRFFVIGQKSREKFMQLSPKLKMPGDLIVLAVKKSNDDMQAREDYAALACAVQNMSLFLASEGFGSKWTTGQITRADATYDLLNLNKSEFEICGFLWMGKASAVPMKPERPPIEHFVTFLE